MSMTPGSSLAAQDSTALSLVVLSAALQESTDCIKVLDLDGRLLSMNAGGQQTMEIDDPSVCQNLLWPDFWAGDDRLLVEAALNRARAGQRSTFEGQANTFKGTPKWWEVRVVPLLDEQGAVQQLLAVSRDVTARKQAELALNALNADLERQVAERTSQALQDAQALRAFMVFSEAVGTRTDVVALAQEAASLLLTQFPSASIGYYLRVTGQWQLQAASDASPGGFVPPEVLPDDHPMLVLASSADQPVFVDDWSATPGRLDTGSTFGTAAGALLRVEGQGQGLLAIGIRGVQNWRDDDRQLVRAVARGLTLALERSAQVRRLEETAVAQRASLAFTEEVGTETDVVALAQQAIGVLQAHLPGSSASLLTPDGELWKAVAWNPDLPETVVQLIRAGVAGSHPLIERLVQTRQPVFVDHWTAPPEQRLAAPELSRTVAAYPLVLNAQVWGTLSVGLKQDRPWQHQDRALIRAVGRALNLALERAEDLRQLSERRVEQEALNDTLTRERTFLQAVLQNMSEGLVACDERGQLTLFNNATRTFHGQDASPLPPEEWAAHYGLFEGDGVTATTTDRVPLYRAWRGEQLREVELVIRPQQGSVRHLLASGGPMFAPDGQPLGAMVTMRDVTLRRETEQQLARSNAQLTRSNAELKAANEELEAFAYSASHDLRTPVRHVQSFSELVRKELEKTPNDPATRYLGFVEQAAGRMSTLIGAMLQLSRSTRQDLASGPVQLDTLLKQVRQELEPEQGGRQVEWRLGRLPEVQGDPELLRQVLTNLLANAVKFSRTREQPVVEVWGAEVWSEGNLVGWTVFVRDNGVGFDEKYRDRLFGVFQRLHTDREFEGTGVGLATVRRIVLRHGGSVDARGTPGQGATFSFTLPREREVPSGLLRPAEHNPHSEQNPR